MKKKKKNIFKKDYYKKYKNLREMISSRAKDSGYKFKQSYIKNIKKVASRYDFTDRIAGTDKIEDLYFYDYEFTYKDKKYLCQELEFYKFKTIQID